MSRQLGEVRLMAADMDADEVRGGLMCPNCRGGQSNEASLSITRKIDGVLFLCHRNKCNFKGFVPMIASVATTKRHVVPDASKKFMGELTPLPDKVREDLIARYNLTEEDIIWAGWMWSNLDGGRVSMPILSRYQHEMGFAMRSLDKKVRPKTRNIIHNNTEPLMCWYKHPDEVRTSGGFTKPVVLVEDCISALRIRRYVNAVSLMGTNLNDDKVIELRRCEAPSFLLALDEDATHTAARHVTKYSELLKNLKMIALKSDLKDSSDEVIKEALFL